MIWYFARKMFISSDNAICFVGAQQLAGCSFGENHRSAQQSSGLLTMMEPPGRNDHGLVSAIAVSRVP
jgi:hypothetical protein